LEAGERLAIEAAHDRGIVRELAERSFIARSFADAGVLDLVDDAIPPRPICPDP